MSGHVNGSWWQFEDILEVGINPDNQIVFRLQWHGNDPETGLPWNTHKWTLLRDMPVEAIDHHVWKTFEKTTEYQQFEMTHPHECPISPYWPTNIDTDPTPPKRAKKVDDFFQHVKTLANGLSLIEAVNVYVRHAKALDRHRPRNWRTAMDNVVDEIQRIVRVEWLAGKQQCINDWVNTMEDSCRPDMIFCDNVQKWLLTIVKQELSKNKDA